MSVIFNSITKFVEAVGRRREHKSNPTQLDSLDCVFFGPQSQTATVCPADLAIHPVFSGMHCTGWSVVDQEAIVAEVHAQYTGKLNAGSGPFTTVPIITASRHLGSVSWSNTAPTSATQLATSGYTARYTAKGVTFKYLTNRRPAPDFGGSFASQAEPYLGTENLEQFQTSLSFATGGSVASAALGYGGFVESTLVWKNHLTDLPVNDLGNGWFEVSEIYMTEPSIDSSIG